MDNTIHARLVHSAEQKIQDNMLLIRRRTLP